MNLSRIALVLVGATLPALAQRPNTNRVPPLGITVAAEDRKALNEEVERFGVELTKARERLSPTTPETEFLPDAEFSAKPYIGRLLIRSSTAQTKLLRRIV